MNNTNKRSFLLIGMLSLLSASAASAGTAEQDKKHFETLCQSCHVAQGKPSLAPPAFAVMHHVKTAHPEREAFIQYVQQWVKSPNADSALMPGAVKRFGLMPSFPYSEAQVRSAAAHLYDNPWKKPGWYDQHFREEHGKP